MNWLTDWLNPYAAEKERQQAQERRDRANPGSLYNSDLSKRMRGEKK
jgi:hypothetical protein